MSSSQNSDASLELDEIQAATAHNKRLSVLAYAGILIAAIVVAAYFWEFHALPSDPASWGQFGDYVGGVLNPTFSFLALLALLATFGLQVRELRISAKELKNSADALVNQNKTLQQQTFEATFFGLLRLHNDIVNATNIPKQQLTGKACYKFYLDALEERVINMAKRKGMISATDQFSADNLIKATKDFAHFSHTYEEFYAEYEIFLGHYFRLLYNIVKFVDGAPVADKKFYTNLIRAQLSSAELKLVFYNCLTQWGIDKFKPLVERYALLKTIPSVVVPSAELFERYDKGAFGGEYPEAWTSPY